jgi:hypothetical protein
VEDGKAPTSTTQKHQPLGGGWKSEPNRPHLRVDRLKIISPEPRANVTPGQTLVTEACDSKSKAGRFQPDPVLQPRFRGN